MLTILRGSVEDSLILILKTELGTRILLHRPVGSSVRSLRWWPSLRSILSRMPRPITLSTRLILRRLLTSHTTPRLELLLLLQACRRTIRVSSSTQVLARGEASTRRVDFLLRDLHRLLTLTISATTGTLPTRLTLLPTRLVATMGIHMRRLIRPMDRLILARTMKRSMAS